MEGIQNERDIVLAKIEKINKDIDFAKIEFEAKTKLKRELHRKLYSLNMEIFKSNYGVSDLSVRNEYIEFVKSLSLIYPYNQLPKDYGHPILLPNKPFGGRTFMIKPVNYDICLPSQKIWDAFMISGHPICLSVKAMKFNDFLGFEDLQEVFKFNNMTLILSK